MSKYLLNDKPALQQRDPSHIPADKNAVTRIVQAAVNVELFTIPLYMGTMFSIHGMHQITAAGSNLYQGRLWPGMSTTARPPVSLTSNQDAFNKVFSVFINEMLHLQLASNICKAVGCNPTFSSSILQNPDRSWKCYGENRTVIPHVLDLNDTLRDSKFHGVKVRLDALNPAQILLFLAIEQTEDDARKNIDPAVWKARYSPAVPFSGWTKDKTEADLPMFGTVGQLYTCLWEYFSIQYTDGTTLWSKMFVPGSIQHDYFNTVEKAEYPLMNVEIQGSDSDAALKQVLDMISGITDQGEGKGVAGTIRKRLDLPQNTGVRERFQPDQPNLEYNYPSYNDTGKPRPSEDAAARGGTNGGLDHYEIFRAVQQLIGKPDFLTWDAWHKNNPRWSAADLITNETDYETNRKNYPELPTAHEIAGALNRLNPSDPKANRESFELLSKVATGSIAIITSALDNYWLSPTAQFPRTEMGVVGDHMTICWAVFGKPADLGLAAEGQNPEILYHACLGMSLDPKCWVQDSGRALGLITHG